MPKLLDPLKRLLERKPKIKPHEHFTQNVPTEIADKQGDPSAEYYNFVMVAGGQTGPDGSTQGAYALANGKSADITKHPLPQDPHDPRAVFIPNGSVGITKAIGLESMIVEVTNYGIWHLRRQDLVDYKPGAERKNPLREAQLDNLRQGGKDQYHAEECSGSIRVSCASDQGESSRAGVGFGGSAGIESPHVRSERRGGPRIAVAPGACGEWGERSGDRSGAEGASSLTVEAGLRSGTSLLVGITAERAKKAFESLGFVLIKGGQGADHFKLHNAKTGRNVYLKRHDTNPRTLYKNVTVEAGVSLLDFLDAAGIRVDPEVRRRYESEEDVPEEATADPILTLSGEDFVMNPTPGYVLGSPRRDVVERSPDGTIVVSDAFFDLPVEGRARALSRVKKASLLITAAGALIDQAIDALAAQDPTLRTQLEQAAQFLLAQGFDEEEVIEQLQRQRKWQRSEGTTAAPDVDGAELVGQTGRYYIYRIDTFEAARALGSKNWCIVRDQRQWDQYMRDFDPTFYFHVDKQLGPPAAYAVAKKTHQGQTAIETYDASNDIALCQIPEVQEEHSDAQDLGVMFWEKVEAAINGDTNAANELLQHQQFAQALNRLLAEKRIKPSIVEQLGVRLMELASIGRGRTQMKNRVRLWLETALGEHGSVDKIMRNASVIVDASSLGDLESLIITAEGFVITAGPERLKTLKEKYPQHSSVIDYLAGRDPTGAHYRYLDWAVRTYLRGFNRDDGLYNQFFRAEQDIADAIVDFHKIVQYLGQQKYQTQDISKDINSYKTLEELRDAVDRAEEALIGLRRIQHAEKEYPDPKWKYPIREFSRDDNDPSGKQEYLLWALRAFESKFASDTYVAQRNFDLRTGPVSHVTVVRGTELRVYPGADSPEEVEVDLPDMEGLIVPAETIDKLVESGALAEKEPTKDVVKSAITDIKNTYGKYHALKQIEERIEQVTKQTLPAIEDKSLGRIKEEIEPFEAFLMEGLDQPKVMLENEHYKVLGPITNKAQLCSIGTDQWCVANWAMSWFHDEEFMGTEEGDPHFVMIQSKTQPEEKYLAFIRNDEIPLYRSGPGKGHPTFNDKNNRLVDPSNFQWVWSKLGVTSAEPEEEPEEEEEDQLLSFYAVTSEGDDEVHYLSDSLRQARNYARQNLSEEGWEIHNVTILSSDYENSGNEASIESWEGLEESEGPTTETYYIVAPYYARDQDFEIAWANRIGPGDNDGRASRNLENGNIFEDENSAHIWLAENQDEWLSTGFAIFRFEVATRDVNNEAPRYWSTGNSELVESEEPLAEGTDLDQPVEISYWRYSDPSMARQMGNRIQRAVRMDDENDLPPPGDGRAHTIYTGFVSLREWMSAARKGSWGDLRPEREEISSEVPDEMVEKLVFLLDGKVNHIVTDYSASTASPSVRRDWVTDYVGRWPWMDVELRSVKMPRWMARDIGVNTLTERLDQFESTTIEKREAKKEGTIDRIRLDRSQLASLPVNTLVEMLDSGTDDAKFVVVEPGEFKRSKDGREFSSLQLMPYGGDRDARLTFNYSAPERTEESREEAPTQLTDGWKSARFFPKLEVLPVGSQIEFESGRIWKKKDAHTWIDESGVGATLNQEALQGSIDRSRDDDRILLTLPSASASTEETAFGDVTTEELEALPAGSIIEVDVTGDGRRITRFRRYDSEHRVSDRMWESLNTGASFESDTLAAWPVRIVSRGAEEPAREHEEGRQSFTPMELSEMPVGTRLLDTVSEIPIIYEKTFAQGGGTWISNHGNMRKTDEEMASLFWTKLEDGPEVERVGPREAPEEDDESEEEASEEQSALAALPIGARIFFNDRIWTKIEPMTFPHDDPLPMWQRNDDGRTISELVIETEGGYEILSAEGSALGELPPAPGEQSQQQQEAPLRERTQQPEWPRLPDNPNAKWLDEYEMRGYAVGTRVVSVDDNFSYIKLEDGDWKSEQSGREYRNRDLARSERKFVVHPPQAPRYEQEEEDPNQLRMFGSVIVRADSVVVRAA